MRNKTIKIKDGLFAYIELPNGQTVYIDWSIPNKKTTVDIYRDDCKHEAIKLTGKFETEVHECPCGFEIPF